MSKKSYHYSRRNFITKSTAGLVSLGLLNQIKGASIDSKPAKSIIYRTLGKTGIKLPVISMGVMNANLPPLIEESYKIGIRHFDTAWYYQRGNNEKMVGDVIDRMGVRKDVVIGTKIYLGRDRRELPIPERIRLIEERVNESLERLKTNYIDILYYHSAHETSEIDFPELKELFLKLKKEGKALHVGVSTHTNQNEILKEMLKQGYFDVALVAYNFCYGKDNELIKTMKEMHKEGIGLIAMKTNAGGTRWKQRNDQNMVGEINHTAMLKWVLNNEFITTAIPGYTTYKHMEENFSVAYNLDYTDEERKFLEDNELDKKLAFCMQCGKCLPMCPKNVDIPTLMRVSMYASQYHNYYHSYNVSNDMADNKGLNECKSCRRCTVKCSNNVPIAERIDDLKSMNIC